MAYTGVAAAPFGGPTLLSLLNMSLKTKAAERVRHADQAQREKAAKKFEEEAGMPIEAVGGIVIDEVSFIELGVFGHLDADLRTLLGSDACELLCGGMPLLLAGDCHQKPPPGSTPWHQTMVKVAFGEGENPRRAGATAAKQRGLALLCAARRTELVRLMRARGDEQFIAYQRQMRRAADRQPVPDAFVRALRRVTAPLTSLPTARGALRPLGCSRTSSVTRSTWRSSWPSRASSTCPSCAGGCRSLTVHLRASRSAKSSTSTSPTCGATTSRARPPAPARNDQVGPQARKRQPSAP